MGLPEEVEGAQLEQEGVSAEVLSVRQWGRGLGWGSVLQVEEDFHCVRAEERRALTAVSSV